MKKFLNKILIILLTLSFCLSFTACDGVLFGTNYQKLINEVSQSVIKGVVTVECSFSKLTIGGTQLKQSQGSGEIIAEKDGYYYVITNNHVVYSDLVNAKSEYKIIDYRGGVYDGDVIKTSANDDLALMRFRKGDENLRVFEFAKKNPEKDTKILSIGTPNGQRNFISLGKIRYYTDKLNYDKSPSSNVTYKVIIHSAPIYGGSSGGALIDYDYNLVGVNFAGVIDETDGISYSCAIPIENLLEFINDSY